MEAVFQAHARQRQEPGLHKIMRIRDKNYHLNSTKTYVYLMSQFGSQLLAKLVLPLESLRPGRQGQAGRLSLHAYRAREERQEQSFCPGDVRRPAG